MTPERYQKLTLDYFQGKIDASKLADLLVEEVPMTVGDMGVASGERVMFISNHPRLESQTHIPAELIAGLKGGNSRNFPSFWFPALRQAMIRRVMGDRRFLTVAFDIGWPVAMQELWHLLIRPSGNGRAQKIIERMKEENASLVVFPEGGVRDLQVFRTGFFHIACELDIRFLVIALFSPNLSLRGPNSLEILNVENIGPRIDSVHDFVEKKRRIIEEALAR